MPALSATYSGSYSADATGRLVASSSIAGNAGPTLVFYQSGNGGPALVLAFDSGSPAAASGIAYPQATHPLPLNGRYGMGVFHFVRGKNTLDDLSGQVALTADQTTGALTMSGYVDGRASTGYMKPITGDFQPWNGDGYSGAIAGTLDAQVNLYPIDAQSGFVVGTDSKTSGSVFLGYVAERMRVCPECQ